MRNFSDRWERTPAGFDLTRTWIPGNCCIFKGNLEFGYNNQIIIYQKLRGICIASANSARQPVQFLIQFKYHIITQRKDQRPYTLRPTRLLCMLMAEMMCGCFQCGVPIAEPEPPPSGTLCLSLSPARKRSAAALRVARFKGASVKDLANCLAFDIFHKRFIQQILFKSIPSRLNYYHIWCHHHNHPI